MAQGRLRHWQTMLVQELGRCQLARWGARLGNRKESQSSLYLLLHSLAHARSLAGSCIQVVFSSELTIDTPVGAVSWGKGREVSQSPLTLENKPKQPRRLMTQYTSGNRGPFPLGWVGMRRRRDRQIQRRHNYYNRLLFWGTED